MSFQSDTPDLNKKIHLQIQNIISTADLKQPIDITKFNDYGWGRYDVQNNYNGRVGYVKDTTMQGRVTIFTTGKMISTGAKSIPHSVHQLERSMELLVINSFVKRTKLKPLVRNMVATFSIASMIDLNKAAEILKSIYEPDQFPGLIYRTSFGPVCLIFASGRIVIAGAKSEDQLHATATHVSKILIQFTLF